MEPLPQSQTLRETLPAELRGRCLGCPAVNQYEHRHHSLDQQMYNPDVIMTQAENALNDYKKNLDNEPTPEMLAEARREIDAHIEEQSNMVQREQEALTRQATRMLKDCPGETQLTGVDAGDNSEVTATVCTYLMSLHYGPETVHPCTITRTILD